MIELDELMKSTMYSVMLSIIPILICLTLHEIAHGLIAYMLGDDTAKSMGRLSLNPFRHLDLVGTIMLIFFGFGYAKPVPVNMYRFKNPKTGMAIVALAGPMMNILISAVCLLIHGMLYGANSYGLAASLISRTTIISANLAVFNLIPIPPLDGSKILFSFLPEKIYYKSITANQIGGIILMILIMFGILSPFLTRAVGALLTHMDWIEQIGYALTA